MEVQLRLTPTQQRTLQRARYGATINPVAIISGDKGSGKTSILRQLHQETGGAFLNLRNLVERMDERHPLALEETFFRMMREAMQEHETVYVDDLHHLDAVASGCKGYPRSGYLDALLGVLATLAAEMERTLFFGSQGRTPSPLRERSCYYRVPDFEPEDYAVVCAAYLPAEVAVRLDYAQIHRYASDLDGHQLRFACLCLRSDPQLDTQRFIEYLRSASLTSNVDLREVQSVDLRDLKGIPDIIESLEANIVLPLENDALSQELGLRPKRGVLLAGPPGTGKTTVGRALAHRLRGKFFKVDGTFISGTNGFYHAIDEVFAAAKKNSPSVIFIDDSDVIFEKGEEHGLYRYLLTMLDGLESESVGQVCVMMTAMDVGAIPPALLRSGRVELWLEMPLPDAAARHDILQGLLAGLPPSLAVTNLAEVVAATEGFTGADLKRLVQDAKNLLAFDRVREREAASLNVYLLRSIDTLVENRERYATAKTGAGAQKKTLAGV